MKNLQKVKIQGRKRRHNRVRAKIKGTEGCPRFSVYRSLKHIYAQLIDDDKAKTLVAASDSEIKKTGKEKKTEEKREIDKLTTKAKIAHAVGQLIAKKALEKKIERVVFDRGGYRYHGRIKAMAEGARAGGLKF